MIERPVAYPVSLSVDTLCLSRRTQTEPSIHSFLLSIFPIGFSSSDCDSTAVIVPLKHIYVRYKRGGIIQKKGQSKCKSHSTLAAIPYDQYYDEITPSMIDR